MLLSYHRRFIFIHIQKTGGSSVEAALSLKTPDAIRSFQDLPACHDPQKRRHLFATDLKSYLGPSAWDSYYKFAFVRNPWSRLVSWYQMCLERPRNLFMWFVKENAPTFDEFLNLTHGPAEKTTFNQVDYITDESGKYLVDFVGRYERLQEDFASVCRHLGLSVHLPYRNQGPVVNYREFYTETTRQLVAERFARDIAMLGYSFES